MKKKEMTAAERVREAVASAALDQSPFDQIERDPIPFGPDTIWIGANAFQRLVERTAAQYPDDESHDEPDGHPGAGLRQVEDVVMQFQDVMGVRVRLIFGPPDNPLHELDVSDVPQTQGQLDNDAIQKWIQAGASLIADARD